MKANANKFHHKLENRGFLFFTPRKVPERENMYEKNVW